MTIGQLATAVGVGVETIRFYERKGLIKRPSRPRTGYRDYPTDSVDRVAFIRRAKELGFSLREIDELLSLRIRSNKSCNVVKQRAEEKISDIDARIADFKRLKKTLQKLITDCASRAPTEDCPILGALEMKGSRR